MGWILREVCRLWVGGGSVGGLGGIACGSALDWSGSGALALVSERGVELTELQGSAAPHARGLLAHATLLPCVRAAPAAPLLATCRLSAPASNLQAAALVAETALWGHEARLAAELARVRSHARSPATFIYNNDNVIAVLTNHGDVSLFTRCSIGWDIALDISAVIYESFEQRWCIGESDDINFIKDRCCDVQSSSVCWGAMTGSNSCIIVMAQRSEIILFLEVQIVNDTYTLRADIRQEWSTEISEIGSMIWIPLEDEQFLLICSGLNGLIMSFKGKIENNEIILLNSCSLWAYEDQMIVSSVKWYCHREDIVVLIAKNRHLLVFVINSRNEVLQQCVKNVNDFKIIALTKSNSDELYIATSNTSIYLLKVLIKDCVDIEFVEVDIREDFSDYIIHGMTLSPNRAFWVLSAIRKRSALKLKTFMELIFLRFDDFDPVRALINNPTQNLTDMWDCIELLRLQCRKNQSLFQNNYDETFSNPNLSSYSMKVYLILSMLYRKRESTYLKVEIKSVFATLSSETIRDTILVRHAVSMLDTVFQDRKIFQELSESERRIYIGCYTYVKQYCRKYKYDISTYVADDVLRFTDTKVGSHPYYSCGYCNAPLIDYVCSDGHPNQFCIVTFQQILGDDYLVCKVCGASASGDLYPRKPKCTLCDVYLDKYRPPDNLGNIKIID